MGLFIALAVLAVVFVGSFLIPFVVLLLVPGRKGTMRTVREFMVPVSADEAWQRTADRFAYEGFVIDPTGRPARFTAKRPARHYQEQDEQIVTHATKALSAEVTITPAAGAHRVAVALWMNDFVFFDTGEGRQIDLTLHRLLTSELDREPPPVTPSTTFNAVAGVTGACIALALALLPIEWPWLDGRRLVGYGIGVAAGGLSAVGLARSAFAAIRAKPAEVTGKPLATLAYGLGGLAVVAGAAWVVVSIARVFSGD